MSVSDDPDDLGAIGVSLDVDRVLVHWHRQGALIVADQWHSAACLPLPGSVGVPASTARRWIEVLDADEDVVISDVHALGSEWTAERATLAAAGAGAALAVPIADSTGPRGSLAVHTTAPRSWTEADVARLRARAASFASLAEVAAERTSALATRSFETLPLPLLVLDRSGAVLAANQAAREIGLRPGEHDDGGLGVVTDVTPTTTAIVEAALRPIVEGRATTARCRIDVWGRPTDLHFVAVTEHDETEILVSAHAARVDAELDTFDVIGALRDGSVSAAYQPICAADGRVIGAEALCRPADPVLGPIRPDLFVAHAERSGTVAALDRWMLARAMSDHADLAGGDADFVLSVNVAVDTLLTDFGEHAAEVVQRAGLEPSNVQIEITETAELYDGRAQRELGVLADLGFRIALDDFGSGYSSFAYLADLPVDVVKLDRSLLVAAGRSDSALLIARGVCTVVGALDVEVIVEGVETDRDHAVVADLGCRWWQGFRCSPAVDVARFSEVREAVNAEAMVTRT